MCFYHCCLVHAAPAIGCIGFACFNPFLRLFWPFFFSTLLFTTITLLSRSQWSTSLYHGLRPNACGKDEDRWKYYFKRWRHDIMWNLVWRILVRDLLLLSTILTTLSVTLLSALTCGTAKYTWNSIHDNYVKQSDWMSSPIPYDHILIKTYFFWGKSSHWIVT